MSEGKKQSFWGKLFGLEKPEEKSESQAALERATEEPRGEEESLEALRQSRAEETVPIERAEKVDDIPDAAPPEMQAEWLKAGHPNPPEHEPPVPDDIWNPLDTPEAIRAKVTQDRPEGPEAAETSAPAAEPETTAHIEPEPEPLPMVPPVPHTAATTPVEKPKGWFARLSEGLKRSSDQLTTSISAVFTKKKLDEAQLADLEDILIAADLGVDTAVAITDRLRAEKFDKDISTLDVHEALAIEVEAVLGPVAQPLAMDAAHKPFVILMVGVNGSGKTTTIGKLTAKLRAEGKSVLLAAGDTFRAAAVEQLQVWGQRNQTEVVTRPTGADASGLAFDALKKAQDDTTDVLIIDTAGRLQNRTELMDELEKIIRVIKKRDETAPHAVLLTLDATTGQNALNQVEIFGQKAGVTGLVMTKLDGTARGGILVAIAKRFGLPVHFIGVGEAIGDLEPFKADEFARAIIGKE
jgi:fused signal recognition particle receptor